jgi:hypothetical protein
MTVHVLVLCTHNSARSVLGEAMLNHWAGRLGRDVTAHSAGSAPSGRINPFAIEALGNAGIDTAGYRSKSWDEFSADGAPPLSIVRCSMATARVLNRSRCIGATRIHPTPRVETRTSGAPSN